MGLLEVIFECMQLAITTAVLVILIKEKRK
jgi:hypothetical protein